METQVFTLTSNGTNNMQECSVKIPDLHPQYKSQILHIDGSLINTGAQIHSWLGRVGSTTYIEHTYSTNETMTAYVLYWK